MLARMAVPSVLLGLVCYGGREAVARHLPAERKVAAARPGLLALAEQVRAHRLTLQEAEDRAGRLLTDTGARPYVRVETGPGEFAWKERSMGGAAKMVACLGPMGAAGVLFFGLCALFKVEEMQSALNLATARFRRPRPTEVDPSLTEPGDPA
jgi:hypothetical protein